MRSKKLCKTLKSIRNFITTQQIRFISTTFLSARFWLQNYLHWMKKGDIQRNEEFHTIKTMISHSRKTYFLFWRISRKRQILCCASNGKFNYFAKKGRLKKNLKWYKHRFTTTNFNLKTNKECYRINNCYKSYK